MYGVVGTDGVVYGPVAVPALYDWIAQGRVVPTTTLIDGQGRRLMASAAPELQGAFPVAAPTPYFAPVPHAFVPGKSKRAALAYAFFLGFAGAHRFYLGHRATGWAMLLMNLAALRADVGLAIPLVVIATVWLIVDMARIGSGSLREANGAPLR